jgi:hypothetical protein
MAWRALRVAPALLEAAVVVTVVEVGLRTLRLPTLARLCGLVFDPATPVPGTTAGIAGLSLRGTTRRRLKAGLAVLARGPFPDTCLRRALVMGSVLRGRRPRLVVGVRRRDGELLAHAWVVVDGVDLDPMSSRAYAPLVAAETP